MYLSWDSGQLAVFAGWLRFADACPSNEPIGSVAGAVGTVWDLTKVARVVFVTLANVPLRSGARTHPRRAGVDPTPGHGGAGAGLVRGACVNIDPIVTCTCAHDCVPSYSCALWPAHLRCEPFADLRTAGSCAFLLPPFGDPLLVEQFLRAMNVHAPVAGGHHSQDMCLAALQESHYSVDRASDLLRHVPVNRSDERQGHFGEVWGRVS